MAENPTHSTAAGETGSPCDDATPPSKTFPGWREQIRRVSGGVLDLLFPAVCASCGCPRESNAIGLCDACITAIAPPLLHECLRCGAPVGPFAAVKSGCNHCSKDRFAFEQVAAVGQYHGALRVVCKAMKAGNARALTAAMGRLLANRQRARLLAFAPDVTVPVPDHWTSRFRNDQLTATTLCRSVSQVLHVRMEPWLFRKRQRTVPQSTLAPADRRKNLVRAFALRRGVDVTDQRVLLVDDVLTTGTTANRLAKLLRSRGASAIMVAVVARGLGDPRGV